MHIIDRVIVGILVVLAYALLILKVDNVQSRLERMQKTVDQIHVMDCKAANGKWRDGVQVE